MNGSPGIVYLVGKRVDSDEGGIAGVPLPRAVAHRVDENGDDEGSDNVGV